MTCKSVARLPYTFSGTNCLWKSGTAPIFYQWLGWSHASLDSSNPRSPSLWHKHYTNSTILAPSYLSNTSALTLLMCLLCWRLYLIDNFCTSAYKIIIMSHKLNSKKSKNWMWKYIQDSRMKLVHSAWTFLWVVLLHLSFNFCCFRLLCGVCVDPDKLFISCLSDGFLCDIVQSYEVPKWAQT